MVAPLYIQTPEGPIQNPDITDADFAAGQERRRLDNVAALWQAAHDYEYAEISGSATSLLAVGLMQGKPVSLAIKGWIASIWALYYYRKPLVTSEFDAALLDFSGCGPIPHSVPELMQELSV